MQKKVLYIVVAVGLIIIGYYTFQGTSQRTVGYAEEIESQRKEKDELFKTTKESPLTDEQKRTFTSLSYFPITEKYRVHAELHKNQIQQKTKITTTDGSQQEYYIYGNAHIHLEGKEIDVTVYKPVEESEDYLFIPFYDETSGELTYGGGRYVEPKLIEGTSTLEIDFNTAYNPYCVYNDTYICPIPPKSNKLNVSVLAGEKLPDFTH